MSKFKVGDRVKLAGHPHVIGTVFALFDDDDIITIDVDNNGLYNYYTDVLELIEEDKQGIKGKKINM